jgi:quinol monooxygenase YgiN
MPLVNAVFYTVPPEAADEAEALLLELRDRSREEAGCLGFEVARGIDESNLFALHEVWRDQAALEQHYTEAHFIKLGTNGIRRIATERIGHRCRAL